MVAAAGAAWPLAALAKAKRRSDYQYEFLTEPTEEFKESDLPTGGKTAVIEVIAFVAKFIGNFPICADMDAPPGDSSLPCSHGVATNNH